MHKFMPTHIKLHLYTTINSVTFVNLAIFGHLSKFRYERNFIFKNLNYLILEI